MIRLLLGCWSGGDVGSREGVFEVVGRGLGDDGRVQARMEGEERAGREDQEEDKEDEG